MPRRSLRTRKGLDWTSAFGAIAKEAVSLPNAIIDGEIVALDKNGAPDFAALQAALSEQKTDDLIYFAFDLLFDGNEDLRARPLSERKKRLEQLLGAAKLGDVRSFDMSNISKTVVKRCCGPPAACRWKASFPRRSTPATNPAGRKPGRSRNAEPGMRWSSEDGRRPMANSAPCWLASIAASTLSISDGSAPAMAEIKSASFSPV